MYVAQNQALQGYIRAAKAAGAERLRVNQQQVNFAGRRVGINRPDLQYSLNGRRYYVEVEWDTPRGRRSYRDHKKRILANDPRAIVRPIFIPWRR